MNKLTAEGVRNRIIELINARISYYIPGLFNNTSGGSETSYYNNKVVATFTDSNDNGVFDAGDVWDTVTYSESGLQTN